MRREVGRAVLVPPGVPGSGRWVGVEQLSSAGQAAALLRLDLLFKEQIGVCLM